MDAVLDAGAADYESGCTSFWIFLSRARTFLAKSNTGVSPYQNLNSVGFLTFSGLMHKGPSWAVTFRC